MWVWTGACLEDTLTKPSFRERFKVINSCYLWLGSMQLKHAKTASVVLRYCGFDGPSSI